MPEMLYENVGNESFLNVGKRVSGVSGGVFGGVFNELLRDCQVSHDCRVG